MRPTKPCGTGVFWADGAGYSLRFQSLAAPIRGTRRSLHDGFDYHWGLVTSHGAGMAVPDWPNTYGYNMFAFPFSKWVGGVLYEHSHRLMATFVGVIDSNIGLLALGA